MTGPRPESEQDRQARIRRELAVVTQAVREGRLPQAAIQRYVERERITPEMEAARTPLTGLETAGGAIGSAVQGATFNLGDEVAGGLSGLVRGALQPGVTIPQAIREDVGEQRQQVGQFREANPLASLGLELAGGMATGLGAAKVAGAGATGLTAAQRAARVAATGAGGGAIAGAGSGEGLADRAGRAGVGAIAGYAGGKALSAVAPAWSSSVAGGQQVTDDLLTILSNRGGAAVGGQAAGSVSRGTPTVAPAPQAAPTMRPEGVSEAAQRAAARAIGPTAPARDLLEQLERGGMGDEMLAMNVGGDRTVRAVRAAANTPDSDAGQIVNERLARQGGRLGEQVPGDIGRVTGIGSEFPEVTAQRMQDDLGAKVKAGYDAFRALPEVPLDPNDEAQRLFIDRYVNPVIRSRAMTGNLSSQSALSGETVDVAFKNLQRELRGIDAGVSMGNRSVDDAQMLTAMRDRVLRAIGETDPNYAQLARTYALDEDVGKVVQEAFQTGRDIKTPGQATVAMGAAKPAEQKAIRAGNVATLQSAARRGASNADLGDLSQFRDVARAVVGTPEARETFIALHGRDTYDALLERLMPKIRAAAQNAAARGNSTTAKQLLDALAFGDDAALDALNAMASGSPTQGLMRNILGRAITPASRAMRLGIGQTATEAADLLTTKGAPQVRSLLDLLDQLGIEDAARTKAVQPAASAIAGRLPNQRRP
jgi:hypothetical protein